MSKIPESHNSKDSVTVVMISHEAKCFTLETSVSKKWAKSLQTRTPEYSKKTTPKVVSDKNVLLLKLQFQIHVKVTNLSSQVVKNLQERPHQK